MQNQILNNRNWSHRPVSHVCYKPSWTSFILLLHLDSPGLTVLPSELLATKVLTVWMYQYRQLLQCWQHVKNGISRNDTHRRWLLLRRPSNKSSWSPHTDFKVSNRGPFQTQSMWFLMLNTDLIRLKSNSCVWTRLKIAAICKKNLSSGLNVIC